MTAIAPIEQLREVAFSAPNRRLRSVVVYGAALGAEGVAAGDAMELIEDAIYANGRVSIGKSSHERAWATTLDRAMSAHGEAFEARERQAEIIDLDEYRALRDAPEILETFSDCTNMSDFCAALKERFSTLSDEAATDIATNTLKRLALPPAAQRAPHPTMLFETVRVEPNDCDWSLHHRAVLLLRTVTGATATASTEYADDASPVDRIMGLANELRDKSEDYPDAAEASSALRRVALGMERAERSDGHLTPVDLWAHHEAPELPRDLLPAIIEDFAFAQGELMGADPAGVAMSALAVCAAAIPAGIKLRVKRHDDWTESALLWVGLVGMPSTKKSPIMRAASSPLRKLNDVLVARHEAEVAAIARLPKKEQEGRDRPKQQRVLSEDATMEGLQSILRDSPDGILSMQDELSGWFGSMEKYNAGRGAAADRAFWLQAFNGGSYVVDRVIRGIVAIPSLSIGVLGGIQPDPLRRIANDMVDDGLIQRFLPVILKPARVGQDKPAGNQAATYSDLVRRLNRLRPVSAGGNLSATEPVRFSAEAQTVRDQVECKNFELVSAIEVISPKLAAHFGKHDGIFARLCLLWHCVEGSETVGAEISAHVATRVATFMTDYLRPSAIAFYTDVLGVAGGHETLMSIASVIVAERLDEVTARDVSRPVRSLRNCSPDDVRRQCERLEAFGWLERIDPRQKSNTPRWRVLPAVHELFAERGRQDKARREDARRVVMEAFAAS